MKRLAICVSHPIQHFSPWFGAMAKEADIDLKIFYGSRHGLEKSLDSGFGQKFSWDIPLLEGYEHEFLENKSSCPGVDTFFGIRSSGLLERLSLYRPDAVMVLGWQLFYYWQAVFCANKMRVPYFVRGESNLFTRGNIFKWRIKTETIGRLCRGAAYCLAIGKLNASLYEAYGVPKEKIRLAPYVVDNERFVEHALRLKFKRNELRASLRIPKDDIVFLFMGKLVQKKRPDDLVKAFLSLPEAARDCSSLLLVGDGAMRSSLEEMAGGNKKIRFAGFLNQSQIPEAYAVSDVLMLPSGAGETWGLVVNEAMASGLPTIVSDKVGCGPDLIIDEQTGYVFQCGNVNRLAEIMNDLIGNSEKIALMGQRSAEHIKEFSISRVVREVRSVLLGIAEQ